MSTTPQRLSAASIDLAPRIQHTSTVAASPAGATETVVASLTVLGNFVNTPGIVVFGFGAFTIGTDGVSYNLKLRQTGASGTTLKATGVIALATTLLGSASLVGFDAAPVFPNQVYVLTATIASASAESAFSAVELVAIVL